MISFKNFIFAFLLIIAGSVAIFFAIKYSSYKTRVLILKEDDKYNLNNYVRIVNSDRKLNALIRRDRENEKIKITELRNDDTYATFIRILQSWRDPNHLVDGSNNKPVRPNK